MRIASTTVLAILVFQLGSVQAEIISLTPLNDSSIYSDSDNAGSGKDVIHVGRNNSGALKRGLIEFDIAGSLPANAIINDASLVFHQDNDRSNTISLHRITADWGTVIVGSGGSGGGGGQGDPPVAGVVTWNYRIYDDQPWTNSGGDFVPTASASQDVDPTSTDPAQNYYAWVGPGLVSDLQYWLNNPTENFGWMMVGIESGNTLVRLYSSESSVSDYVPELTIDYTTVPEPHTLMLVMGGLIACCPLLRYRSANP